MNSVKAAREIEKICPFHELTPANQLLSDRLDNEAYLVAKPGEVYVVFFPDSGEVKLDLRSMASEASIRWLNVREGEWNPALDSTVNSNLTLKTPGMDEWVAVITLERQQKIKTKKY